MNLVLSLSTMFDNYIWLNLENILGNYLEVFTRNYLSVNMGGFHLTDIFCNCKICFKLKCINDSDMPTFSGRSYIKYLSLLLIIFITFMKFALPVTVIDGPDFVYNLLRPIHPAIRLKSVLLENNVLRAFLSSLLLNGEIMCNFMYELNTTS